MKKIFMIAVVAMFATATISAQTATTPAATTQEDKNKPELKFETEVHDFGTIKEGTQAKIDFKFANIGKEALILSSVNASCGCTTPSYTKEPVKKGEKGTVTAVYNSQGRPGPFTKTITVNSNALTSVKILTIKGVVEPAANGTPVNPANTASPVINK